MNHIYFQIGANEKNEIVAVYLSFLSISARNANRAMRFNNIFIDTHIMMISISKKGQS